MCDVRKGTSTRWANFSYRILSISRLVTLFRNRASTFRKPKVNLHLATQHTSQQYGSSSKPNRKDDEHSRDKSDAKRKKRFKKSWRPWVVHEFLVSVICVEVESNTSNSRYYAGSDWRTLTAARHKLVKSLLIILLYRLPNTKWKINVSATNLNIPALLKWVASPSLDLILAAQLVPIHRVKPRIRFYDVCTGYRD